MIAEPTTATRTGEPDQTTHVIGWIRPGDAEPADGTVGFVGSNQARPDRAGRRGERIEFWREGGAWWQRHGSRTQRIDWATVQYWAPIKVTRWGPLVVQRQWRRFP